MDKETYLRYLRALLATRVPERDVEDIVRFYTEYFEEAGPEKEAEVMAALGSPEELARKIMEQREQEDRQEEAEAVRAARREALRGDLPRWLGILLAVFIGICIASVLGSLALGFVVAGPLCVLGGVITLVVGVFVGGLAAKLYVIGGALIAGAVGLILLAVGAFLFRMMVMAMKSLWNKLVEGGHGNEAYQ